MKYRGKTHTEVHLLLLLDWQISIRPWAPPTTSLLQVREQRVSRRLEEDTSERLRWASECYQCMQTWQILPHTRTSKIRVRPVTGLCRKSDLSKTCCFCLSVSCLINCARILTDQQLELRANLSDQYPLCPHLLVQNKKRSQKASGG